MSLFGKKKTKVSVQNGSKDIENGISRPNTRKNSWKVQETPTPKLQNFKATSFVGPDGKFQLPSSKQQLINILIGNERDWCSKSEEAQIFRRRIKESRIFDKNSLDSAVLDEITNFIMERKSPTLDNEHQVISQQSRFSNTFGVPMPNSSANRSSLNSSNGASSPTISNRSPGFQKILRISLMIPQENSDPIYLCKAVSVDTNRTLNDIISNFIEQNINLIYNLQLDRTEYILKYKIKEATKEINTNNSNNSNNISRSSVNLSNYDEEFLFGDTPLKYFKCIYNEKITEFQLLKTYEATGYLEKDWNIKVVSYGFDKYRENQTEHSFLHDSISYTSMEWFKMDCISMWDLEAPFNLCIRGVDILPTTTQISNHLKEIGCLVEDMGYYICVEILHGAYKLAPKHYTKMVPYSSAPRFNEWISFEDLKICNIPREAKICFTLYCRPYDRGYNQDSMNFGSGALRKKDYPAAMVCTHLIDYKNNLRSGLITACMWPDEAAGATQTCAENLSDDITLPPTILSFELPEYAFPVVFPSGEPPERLISQLTYYEKIQTRKHGKLARSTQEQEISNILDTDPLYKLKDSEKWHIWMNRDSLKEDPKALCKFLLSVPWDQPYAVHMVHCLIDEWEEPDPISALELLDYNYPDSKVRQYALSRVNKLCDEDIAPFLLQLVQILKYELTHDSALSRFLLQRGLRNTKMIGHVMFWHLAAEMHIPSIRERHGLILEEYLNMCGSHLESLAKQKYVINDLSRIAYRIKDKEIKGLEAKIEYARHELENIFWPEEFCLPLNPNIVASGIIPSKCKVMSSKKLPLWLVFKNAEVGGKDIYVIFKAGDDLRQDLLTLQLFKVMDNLWKKEDLNLHLQPYGCVCLGDEVGMIEIVLNADTIGNITAERGGAKAALKSDPLEVWLKKNNPTPEEYAKCVDNFMYSCAGYCCATYVLGIGDRHNDNIMLQRNGNMFHIDFGHFLGNYKTILNIKRETTPFVFTPMYAQVLEGKSSEKFNEFVKYGSAAFNILRKNSHLLMTLFLLMLGTGIPELTSAKDVEWLRRCLYLDKSNEEASDAFRSLVMNSLKNQRVKLNDVFHIAKHKRVF